MARIKQRVMSYKTAEREFNRKKVVLHDEFASEMHKACEANDMEYFEALKTDFRHYFGEPGELTIVSIELLYGIITVETN